VQIIACLKGRPLCDLWHCGWWLHHPWGALLVGIHSIREASFNVEVQVMIETLPFEQLIMEIMTEQVTVW